MEKMKKKKRKTFTRRDFLKGLGGGAIGATVASKLLAQEQAYPQAAEEKIAIYSKKQISFTLNGKSVTLEVEPRETLLQVLRERLKLTGTKKTCGRGECGGCTVLLDGDAVYSCIYPAIRADRKEIMTIEGLASSSGLHPLQQAFIDKDAFQCGFCTPGFIIAGFALLNKNKAPSLEVIKTAMTGNICRCGNYQKIYEAVAAASQTMRGVLK